MKKCAECGSTENLQKHHISYNPEIMIDLCVDCHQKRHPHHGVGPSSYDNKTKLKDIKIPTGLIEDLNSFMGGETYLNNSELVRDALRRYLENNRAEDKK